MKALLLAAGFAAVASVPPLTVALVAGLGVTLAGQAAFIARASRRRMGAAR